MNYETIEYEIIEDGIGVLSLNRPRRYNSVNQKMAEELEDFWRERLYDLDTHVIILKGNGTDTLGDSWDAGVLDYSLNYEIDFEAMKPSAFLLIGQLLTFNNPDFGIPGLFGEIVGYAVSLGIWALIIIISYTVITKLIPTIQGGVEN